MSGFDGHKKREDVTKVPGKQSGVTANDLASQDPGNLQAPGKRNLVQTWGTGLAYSDKGPACLVDPSKPGCFMTEGQRTRYDLMLTERFISANMFSQMALLEVQFDKLIQKEDDIPWWLSIVLDAATAYIGGAVLKSLLKIKSMPITDAMAMGLEEQPDPTLFEKSLSKLSDSSITSLTKKATDFAGKKTKSGLKTQKNDPAQTKKTEALSYIQMLKVQYAVAFEQFYKTVMTSADDAQRVVIYDGLSPELHAEPLYKVAFEEKIKRYHDAKISDVGKKLAVPQGFNSHYTPEIYDNKRCVWLKNPDGSNKLWFLTVTSNKDDNPWADGRDPKIEPVPDEFVEAAQALSEQKWGPTPLFMNPATALANKGNVSRLQLGKGNT